MTARRSIHVIAVGLALTGGGAATAALASAANAPASARRASIPSTAGFAADHAAVRLSHGCYQTAERATLRGSGFDPSSHWSARLDGRRFGSGTTDSSGRINATFGVPNHLRPGSSGEDTYKLVVREGKHSASAKFLVTRLDASFSPTRGDVGTLKVRFRLLGWGRGGSLYLHYINPKGVSRRDRNLGAPQGSCGHLSTAPLKLFPFTPTVGKWTLQFDKSAAYKPDSVPRVAVRYKIS